MKRNIALLLCILLLLVSCFTACNDDKNNGTGGGTDNPGGGTTDPGGNPDGPGEGGGTEDHVHTFSTDVWYNDAEEHWRPATCEHAETERGSLAAHEDADQDGLCDVCEYEVGHEHTYSEDWSFDADHHWKEATCLHTEENDEYGSHVDENMDGSCDECEGHVHAANEAGFCKYCGEKVKDIDNTDLLALIEAIMSQSGRINGGTIDYNFEGRSNTGSAYTASRNELVEYLFGKDNYTNVKVNTTSINAGNKVTGTFESWHQLVGEDTAFGVYSEDGGELKLDLAEAAKLNGYYIALSTLAGDYGVEATLYALYEAAISDTTTDLVIIPAAGENKITFTYDYKTVFVNATDVAVGDENTPAGSTIYNVNYFYVEVTFTYSDDLALTGLEIKCDVYTNDPGTADGIGFLYDDVDIQYDHITGEISFVKYDHNAKEYVPLSEGEKPTPDTYTITVTQNVGERTEENPNPRSKFVPKSFNLYGTKVDIYDEKGNNVDYTLEDKITGLFNVKVGDIVRLYVSDYSPSNASLHYIADQVSFKLYLNGVEVENPNSNDNLLYDNPTAVADFTFAGELRNFFIIPKVDGVYKFEIFVAGKLEKTVDFIVGVAEPEDIELKDNQFAVKVTETYQWANEVTFTAKSTGRYYFNVPAGIGFIDADGYDKASETEATDDGPEPYLDYNNLKNDNGTYNAGSFYLDLEEGETVRFYVNSISRGTFVITFATM